MPSRMKRHAVIQPSDPSYRFIALTQGQNAVVDAADFDWLNQWCWQAQWDEHRQGFFAKRALTHGGVVLMHRLIAGAQSPEEVDHRNHDGLDNRRKNLRRCTKAQNAMNKRTQKQKVGHYKGVHNRSGPNGPAWRALIRSDRKLIHVGTFKSAEEAARAYDKAAKELHGEFAHLNFPAN